MVNFDLHLAILVNARSLGPESKAGHAHNDKLKWKRTFKIIHH